MERCTGTQIWEQLFCWSGGWGGGEVFGEDEQVGSGALKDNE